MRFFPIKHIIHHCMSKILFGKSAMVSKMNKKMNNGKMNKR